MKKRNSHRFQWKLEDVTLLPEEPRPPELWLPTEQVLTVLVETILSKPDSIDTVESRDLRRQIGAEISQRDYVVEVPHEIPG